MNLSCILRQGPRLSLAVVLLLGACAGQAQKISGSETQQYVSADLLPPDLLSSPIPENSKIWKQELKEVLTVQKNVPKTDKEAAVRETHLSPSMIATDVLGPEFNAEALPLTFKLLENVKEECEDLSRAAKNYWKTDRPFLKDTRIAVLVKRPQNHAYPSGHTACARVVAEVTGQLVPARKDALRQRAAEVGYHRIQAGVHYRHDIEGGKELALLYIGALQNSAAYQHDLRAAKAETTKKGL